MCPSRLDDAKAIAHKFAELFSLFSECHNSYNKVDFFCDIDISELGEWLVFFHKNNVFLFILYYKFHFGYSGERANHTSYWMVGLKIYCFPCFVVNHTHLSTLRQKDTAIYAVLSYSIPHQINPSEDAYAGRACHPFYPKDSSWPWASWRAGRRIHARCL